MKGRGAAAHGDDRMIVMHVRKGRLKLRHLRTKGEVTFSKRIADGLDIVLTGARGGEVNRGKIMHRGWPVSCSSDEEELSDRKRNVSAVDCPNLPGRECHESRRRQSEGNFFDGQSSGGENNILHDRRKSF